MKKLRIIKWIIIYSLIYVGLFAIYLGIETSNVVNNSTFVESNEEGDISYQLVNSRNASNILIWDSEVATENVVRVDEGRNRFKIIDDTYCNEKIYFQYSYYNKKNREVFGIGIYDLCSNETNLFDMKGFEEYNWESISKKDDKVYMLLNDVKNGTVKEYRVEIKEKIVCELEQEYAYPEEHCIIDTVYYNGKVYMHQDNGKVYYYNDVNIVKDDDIDKNIFKNEDAEINKNASKSFKSNVFGNMLKDKILAIVVAFLVIGIITICLAISRSFILKLMIVAELGFIVVTAIIMSGVADRIEKNEIDRIIEYGIEQLEEVRDIVNVSGIVDYQKLSEINNQLGNKFEDIIVINREKEETIVTGALGLPSDADVPAKYSKLVKKVSDTDSKRMKSGNTEYMAIAICESIGVNSQMVIIGVVELSSTRETVSEIMASITDKTIMLFIIVSLFMISVFIYYAIHYGRFSHALLKMVNKHDEYKGIKAPSKDLSREWSALDEINRVFNNVKYEKNQNLELYNRYIPKEVEKVLGRPSLLDIELGDSVELMGSVATISLEDSDYTSNDIYMQTIEKAYEIVNTNIKKKDGVIVSQDSRMSDTKVLFKENLNNAIEFAIDTIHNFDGNINVADKQKIIVINHSKYQCGITGCEERFIPYLFAKEESVLLSYIESFRRAGIKLILTENAVEKADKKFSFRYIGYITEKGINIKIYECLDAYLPIKKNLLVNTQAKFKKALGLFYSNDFYLARNTFNEVLKENPDDKVARWYLFNCESNLNNINDENTSYGLFENKILEQQYQI